MRTHFAPFTDLDDVEQAPCGTWLGESSELSGDWAMVDCLRCKKRRERIITAAAEEGRSIVEQMGDMAAFMRAEDSAPYSQAVTPLPSIHCRDMGPDRNDIGCRRLYFDRLS